MDGLLDQTIDLLTTEVKRFRMEERRVFATSSFQTQSVPLLHIIGSLFPEISVLFLDTGFLFPETYEFRNKLQALFNLNVISLRSHLSPHQQIDQTTGLLQYAINPDRCCYINKVKPLEDYLQEGDVWISGVRKDQTAIRRHMKVIEKGRGNTLKLHPMLNWTGKDIYTYIRENRLPKHPLEEEGYISIGCIPCTHKWTGDDPRSGRWVGSQKTECGLHAK